MILYSIFLLHLQCKYHKVYQYTLLTDMTMTKMNVSLKHVLCSFYSIIFIHQIYQIKKVETHKWEH